MERSVLVTGASSGIGLAASLHLADLGFRTFAAARTEDGIRPIVEAARDAAVEVEPLAFDVTEHHATIEAVEGLDLYALVNNAGYYNVGAVEDVSSRHALRQLEAMVEAPVRLARLVLPSMRRRGEGRIVNVTSSIIYLTGALTGWYQASKRALDAVSDALRIEVASSGVEVIKVEPGGIDTDIWNKAEDDLLRRRPTSGYADAYERALAIMRTLQGRMHDPQNAAEVIGDALTAGRPRRRYRVGTEAVALRLVASLLPSSVRDRFVRAVLAL